MLRRLDAPVTERNRLVALALKLFLVVRNAAVFSLNSQFGHQVKRFLANRQQLQQPPQIGF
ncbi:MAG TPA: hypothetical protein PKD55_15245 [Bellilinea sp.]|nr:hypothetical protein [Bellilinea sp.]